MNLEENIYNELKYVFDPEIGVNIVDLGYVDHIEIVNESTVKISLVFLTDDLVQQDYICSGVEFAALSVEGINKVIVVKEAVKWNPNRLNEKIKRELIGIN